MLNIFKKKPTITQPITEHEAKQRECMFKNFNCTASRCHGWVTTEKNETDDGNEIVGYCYMIQEKTGGE